LRYVCGDLETFPWDLHAAAKGVQLAELGYRSWQERRWLDVPPLEAYAPHGIRPPSGRASARRRPTGPGRPC
jgi:hypothetical protein